MSRPGGILFYRGMEERFYRHQCSSILHHQPARCFWEAPPILLPSTLGPLSGSTARTGKPHSHLKDEPELRHMGDDQSCGLHAYSTRRHGRLLRCTTQKLLFNLLPADNETWSCLLVSGHCVLSREQPLLKDKLLDVRCRRHSALPYDSIASCFTHLNTLP